MAVKWTFSNAQVVRVVDGDTVLLEFDHDAGFNETITRRRSFRLLGINAPEKNTPLGREAARYLASLLPVGTVVLLESVKVDKYATADGARYDANVRRASDGLDVAADLLAVGLAAPWDGAGAKPTPATPQES